MGVPTMNLTTYHILLIVLFFVSLIFTIIAYLEAQDRKLPKYYLITFEGYRDTIHKTYYKEYKNNIYYLKNLSLPLEWQVEMRGIDLKSYCDGIYYYILSVERVQESDIEKTIMVEELEK